MDFNALIGNQCYSINNVLYMHVYKHLSSIKFNDDLVTSIPMCYFSHCYRMLMICMVNQKPLCIDMIIRY